MAVAVRRAEAPIVEETAADAPMPTPAEYPLNGGPGPPNEKPPPPHHPLAPAGARARASPGEERRVARTRLRVLTSRPLRRSPWQAAARAIRHAEGSTGGPNGAPSERSLAPLWRPQKLPICRGNVLSQAGGHRFLLRPRRRAAWRRPQAQMRTTEPAEHVNRCARARPFGGGRSRPAGRPEGQRRSGGAGRGRAGGTRRRPRQLCL